MRERLHAWAGLLLASAIALPTLSQPLAILRAEELFADEISIDEKNFPDPEFRSLLLTDYDLNRNKKLSASEINNIREINLQGKGITTLKGIEYLTNLTKLDCENNALTELDLSKNILLETLECSINKISKLDISKCVGMKNFYCDQNYLQKLDLSNMPKLRQFSCSFNDLSELDLSKNEMLIDLICGSYDYYHSGSERVDGDTSVNNHISNLVLGNKPYLLDISCEGNKLKDVDFSGCSIIESISCDDNDLTSLNLTGFPFLQYLFCNRNNLTQLELPESAALTLVYCEENDLKSMKVSNCPNLEVLDLYDNQITDMNFGKGLDSLQSVALTMNDLTQIDISMLPALETLNIEENKLTEVDISGLMNISELYCNSNPIKKLDVSGSKSLTDLYCMQCGLEELKLSGNDNLNTIYCSNNNLKKLDIHDCLNLVILDADSNKLSTLDISRNIKLEGLQLGWNEFTSITIGKNVRLKGLDLTSNKLTEIDVHECPNLRSLCAGANQLTTLTLPDRDAMLEQLTIQDNKMKELDLSACPNLKVLNVQNNDFSKLDVTKNPLLEDLITDGNPFKELDITRCMTIKERLEKYGVTLSDNEDCYIGIIHYEDGSDEFFFSVNVGVDLKGYDLPTTDPTPTPEPDPTPDPDPTPTPPAEDPTFEDFVERLYTVALGRASEPEGKEFWIKQVVEEGKTGADCARFFLLDAPEFMDRKLSTEDFVETLYKTFFDRESDAEGKKGWVDAISSGRKTRAEVVNDFIESTEWCDVCATYGVKSGAKYHKATKASKNAINFATRLYTCCLKRDAEEGGLQYWSLALTNQEKTGAEAAQFFFESDEFIGFKTTANEYLTRLYTTFMDREPAESEVNYWLGEIADGRQTRHSILAFFAQSEEFTGICKEYGIDRGEIA